MTEINKLIFSVAAGMCKQKQQKKLTLFSSRKRNEHSLPIRWMGDSTRANNEKGRKRSDFLLVSVAKRRSSIAHKYIRAL